MKGTRAGKGEQRDITVHHRYAFYTCHVPVPPFSLSSFLILVVILFIFSGIVNYFAGFFKHIRHFTAFRRNYNSS